MNNVSDRTVRHAGLPRLLIVGCGDIGMRLLPLVRARFRVFAVNSDVSRCAAIRAAGAVPIIADLDHRDSLARLRGLAQFIVHLVPPQSEGVHDQRTRNLASVLPSGARVVYVSTTGVYGDCDGVLFDETRPIHPQSDRARRRADAEQVLRRWRRDNGARLAILRVPGIYAVDRLPVGRLQKRLPALRPEEDVYTNHIHADDLARIITLALFRAQSGRIYHACDDSELKMGDYFDVVAEVLRLPPPPRLSRADLASSLSPLALSFMGESRRLSNIRLKAELGMRLHYPQVCAGLKID